MVDSTRVRARRTSAFAQPTPRKLNPAHQLMADITALLPGGRMTLGKYQARGADGHRYRVNVDSGSWQDIDAGAKGEGLDTLRSRLSADSGSQSEALPLVREPGKPTPFPIDALGPVLAPAARAIARAVQVPHAMAGQSVLGAAALAVQALADVETPFGERKPLTLFLATIAGSGDRKSTTDTLALRGVREWERRRIDEWRSEMAEYRQTMKQYELDVKRAAREGMDLDPEEPERPISQYRIVEDATCEALVKLMERNQPSVGLFSPEGGKIVGGYAMGDRAKTYSAGVLNGLWDNGAADRWRSMDVEAVRLRGRRLTAHLMLQPQIAGKLLGDRDLADQGFLARWLITAPESLMGSRVWHGVTVEDTAAIDALAARLQALLTTAPRYAVSDSGEPLNELEPMALQLAAESRAIWIAFYDEVEGKLGPDGELRPIAGTAAKCAEQALRIAGVITLAGDADAGRIETAAMAGAVELCRHYLSEAMRLHGAGQVEAELTDAGELHRRLAAKWQGGAQFSVGDTIALRLPFLNTSRDARKLLKVLEEHGLAECHLADGKGGRRLERWCLPT